MGHYLNVYGVPRENPDKKVLLFDMTAGNEEWDFYTLFRDAIDPAYPAEYRDGEVTGTDATTDVTADGLTEIIEELNSNIARSELHVDSLYRIRSGDPEQTVFEVVRQREYIAVMTKQKHALEFLRYVVEQCGNSWSGFSKIVCTAD